jgi:hypothetical protein
MRAKENREREREKLTKNLSGEGRKQAEKEALLKRPHVLLCFF